MAEFSEVMRQAKKMCKLYTSSCEGCALNSEDYGCLFQNDENPEDRKLNLLADAEKIVMNWAAQNPEPRYPTWKEWQDANFPDALSDMCPRMFGYAPEESCVNISCKDCAERTIPAEIAKKLGIKPIGGVENA